MNKQTNLFKVTYLKKDGDGNPTGQRDEFIACEFLHTAVTAAEGRCKEGESVVGAAQVSAPVIFAGLGRRGLEPLPPF